MRSGDHLMDLLLTCPWITEHWVNLYSSTEQDLWTWLIDSTDIRELVNSALKHRGEALQQPSAGRSLFVLSSFNVSKHKASLHFGETVRNVTVPCWRGWTRNSPALLDSHLGSWAPAPCAAPKVPWDKGHNSENPHAAVPEQWVGVKATQNNEHHEISEVLPLIAKRC